MVCWWCVLTCFERARSCTNIPLHRPLLMYFSSISAIAGRPRKGRRTPSVSDSCHGQFYTDVSYRAHASLQFLEHIARVFPKVPAAFGFNLVSSPTGLRLNPEFSGNKDL